MNKKDIFVKSSKIMNLVLSWFNFFMFFAMRCCWSGISKTLGYEKSNSSLILWLPVIVWGGLFVIFVGNICLYYLMNKNKNLWSYILNFINLILLVVIFVIIKMGAVDYLDYIFPEFYKYILLTGLILLIIFFIFKYPKTKLHMSNYFKFGLLSIVLLLTCGYLVNFTFNKITTGAVVYAVEDEYQIVFSSSCESRAWVEIDDKCYYDNYNGSNRSYTKIHKVSIPMHILDNALEYEIHIQKLTYRGPFGGMKGRDISKKYNFRPVDASDGLDYYSISDIHMAMDASVKTVKNYPNIEFLVVAGDIVSMVDSFADANYVNKVANKITNGEIAVIYARGNHEIKGKYAEELHKFVGSVGERFYYNFYLDGVYGLVLDIGEDHDDDWWEYYETAYYLEYHQEQFKFLEEEIIKGDYENYKYRLVVCHIPIVFVNSRKNHEETKAKLTELLNQMNINMAISGHQHDLLIFEPGVVKPNETLNYNPSFSSRKKYNGYLTDFNFVNITVSKRGKTQTDSASLLNMKEQIGAHISVDFNKNNQTITFNTSSGELVEIANPYALINYGTHLIFSLE